MYAKRMNKIYPVNTAQEKQAYLARGYDICKDDGTLAEYSPEKTVPFSKYEELRHSYGELLADYKSLQANYDALVFSINPAEPPADTPPSGGTGTETGTAHSEVVQPETLHSAEEPIAKMGKKK